MQEYNEASLAEDRAAHALVFVEAAQRVLEELLTLLRGQPEEKEER